MSAPQVWHRPRKRFGQHFLHDAHVISRIVEAINPQPGDTLVEIGPGEGALTRALLGRAGQIHAIEIDRDLADRLRSEFPEARLLLHRADALEFDFTALGDRLKVVGNLPYNISTPMLFHVAAFSERIREIHFMLQLEVVDRMVAEPSTPAYGRLSVMLQTRFRMHKLFRVSAGSFRPPPKVESAVVRLVPLAHHEQPQVDLRLFTEVVAGAFSARRKKLSNALPLGPQEFASLGIDPNLRPENLSPNDYVRVTHAVGAMRRPA